MEFSPRYNGYCYTKRDNALPLMRLTEGEVVVLFLAEREVHECRTG